MRDTFVVTHASLDNVSHVCVFVVGVLSGSRNSEEWGVGNDAVPEGSIGGAHVKIMNINEVRNIAIDGNTLLLAPVGYGKGQTVKDHLYLTLKARYGRNGFTCVTAPTATATNKLSEVEAMTIHSFFGIKTGAGSVDDLVDLIEQNNTCYKRLRRTQALVLDECFMMNLELWKKLEAIARKIMRSNKYFGGIRVILVGDPSQLPPCPDVYEDGSKRPVRKEAKYLFEDPMFLEAGSFKVC